MNKWNDYFGNIRKKYSMRLSYKNPLVIVVDGKGITGNRSINILDYSEKGFLKKLEKTAIYFTGMYDAIALAGTDEIAFVFENPIKLFNDCHEIKEIRNDEVVSIFSQMFFRYYEEQFEDKIYWHTKCYSIPKDKIESFLQYKSKGLRVVNMTNFLKREGVNDPGNLSNAEKEEKCYSNKEYTENIKPIENGILVLKGIKVDNFDLKNILQSLNSTPNQANFDIEI